MVQYFTNFRYCETRAKQHKQKNRVIREIRAKKKVKSVPKKEKSVILNNENKESLTPTTQKCPPLRVM